MKNLFLLLFVLPFLLSCGEDSTMEREKTAQDFVGKTFEIDAYHMIEFKTESSYWIYQKQLSCGGDGYWSIENGKILLGPNDSRCESTRKIQGSFEMSKF